MADKDGLSRRERQIMDVVYARSQATATDVVRELPDPPSRTAVRTLLRILEEKGHLKHSQAGREFVYRPTRPRRVEGKSALKRVVRTFFGGSLSEALAAHFADPDAKPDEAELRKLAELIEQARKRKGA